MIVKEATGRNKKHKTIFKPHVSFDYLHRNENLYLPD